MQIKLSNTIQTFLFISLLIAGALVFFIHEVGAETNATLVAYNQYGSSNKAWGYNNTGDYRAIYQTFKPQETTIQSMKLFISRNTTDCGSGGDNAFRYDLYSGTPNGSNTLLWSSATAGLTNTACKALLPQTSSPTSLVELPFGTSPITVTVNGDYFIKVKSSSYPSNWLNIIYSSSNSYADGTEWYEDASLHELTGQDLVFFIYTTVTIPQPTISYPDNGVTLTTNHVDIIGNCANQSSMPNGSTLNENIFISANDTNKNYQMVQTSCDTNNQYHASLAFLWNETYNVTACQYYTASSLDPSTMAVTCGTINMIVNMTNNPVTLPETSNTGTIGFLLSPFQTFSEIIRLKIPFQWFFAINDAIQEASETGTTLSNVNITILGTSMTLFDPTSAHTLIGTSSWNMLQTLLQAVMWGSFLFYVWERVHHLTQD